MSGLMDMAVMDVVMTRQRNRNKRQKDRNKANWKRNNPNWRKTTNANSIRRGVRIKNAHDHHRGMSQLKEDLGDPRPNGMSLSLINPCSESCYWSNGTRLSLDPSDYIWEPVKVNVDRARQQTIAMFLNGDLDINGQPVHR